MDCCFVEFEPKDSHALARLGDFLKRVMIAKEDDEFDEAELVGFFSNVEVAYFWNPTDDEMKEWNDEWFSTPVATRLSAAMPTPGWTLESMVSALWESDFDLVGVVEVNARCRLTFNPHGYPYGGTGSLVALVECFGHTVVGIEDGTGYAPHMPRTNLWLPKDRRPRERWLNLLLRWKG